MAGGAVPLQPVEGWQEWNSIIADAKSTFLKTAAVANLLERYAPALRAQGVAISHKAPVRPAGGSLFLIDKKSCRSFRKDGHNWVKGPDGKAPRERHVKLKVEGKEKINVYYAKEAGAESHPEGPLIRRCFWLLHPDKSCGQEGLVLVHYLRDRSEPAGSDSSPQTSQSAAAPRAHQLFPQGLELASTFHPWELAGAVPEVMPLQTNLLGNTHPREAFVVPVRSSKRAKPSRALEGDCSGGSFLGLLFEEESPFEPGHPLAATLAHSSAFPPPQPLSEALPTPEWCCLPQQPDFSAEEELLAGVDLEGSAHFVDPFPGEAFAPLSTPSSGSPEGIRSLDPLDHDFSDLEMLLAAPEADSLGFLDAAGMEELELEALPLPQQAQQRAQQAQHEEILPEAAAQAAGLAFVVEDYVPKEDAAAGGAQMLITGELHPEACQLLRGQPLFVRFGSQQVPAELLRSGSVRCRVPPAQLQGQTHQVPLFLALADGQPLSQARPFTYLAAAPLAAPALAQAAAEGSSSDGAAAQRWQQPQQAVQLEQTAQLLEQKPSSNIPGGESSMQGSTLLPSGAAPQQPQRARAPGRRSALQAAANSMAFGAGGASSAVPELAAGGGGRGWSGPSADAMAMPAPPPTPTSQPAQVLETALAAAAAASTPQPAPLSASQPAPAAAAAAAAPAGISLAAAAAAAAPPDISPAATPATASIAAAQALAAAPAGIPLAAAPAASVMAAPPGSSLAALPAGMPVAASPAAAAAPAGISFAPAPAAAAPAGISFAPAPAAEAAGGISLASAPASEAAAGTSLAAAPAAGASPGIPLAAASAGTSLAAAPAAAASGGAILGAAVSAGASLGAAPAAAASVGAMLGAASGGTWFARLFAPASVGPSGTFAPAAFAAPAAPAAAPQAAPALAAPAPSGAAAPSPAAATAQSAAARAAAPGAAAPLLPPAPASAFTPAQPAKPGAVEAAAAGHSSTGSTSGVVVAPLADLPSVPAPAPAKDLRAAMPVSRSPTAAAQSTAATTSVASSSGSESGAGSTTAAQPSVAEPSMAAPSAAEPSAPPGAAAGAGMPTSSQPATAAAASAAAHIDREGSRASGSDGLPRADRESCRVSSREGGSGGISRAVPGLAVIERRQQMAAATLDRSAPPAAGYRVPPSAKPAAGSMTSYVWNLAVLCLLLAWRCLLLGCRLALTAAVLVGGAAWRLRTFLSSSQRDRLVTGQRPGSRTLSEVSQEGLETEGGTDPDQSQGPTEPTPGAATTEQGLPGQPSLTIPSKALLLAGASDVSCSSPSSAPAQATSSMSSSSDGGGGSYCSPAPIRTDSSLSRSSGGAGSSGRAAQGLAASFSQLQVSDTCLRDDSIRDHMSTGCSSSGGSSSLAAPAGVASTAGAGPAAEAAPPSVPAAAPIPIASLSLGQLAGPAGAAGSSAVEPGTAPLSSTSGTSEAAGPAEGSAAAAAVVANYTAEVPHQLPPSGDPLSTPAAAPSSIAGIAGTSSALQPGPVAAELMQGATSDEDDHSQMGQPGLGSAGAPPQGPGPST